MKDEANGIRFVDFGEKMFLSWKWMMNMKNPRFFPEFACLICFSLGCMRLVVSGSCSGPRVLVP